jgi:hypothetical protein
MSGIIKFCFLLLATISLTLLSLAGTAGDVNAQDTSPQLDNLKAEVSILVHDTQTAVSKWNSSYFAGSINDLKPEHNPGLAATGPYSVTIPGASLQTKEIPYYGPSSFSVTF